VWHGRGTDDPLDVAAGLASLLYPSRMVYPLWSYFPRNGRPGGERAGENGAVKRGRVLWRTGLGVGLAAGGGVLGLVLAGGSWALAGAALGAVTGSFSPSVVDYFRSRDEAREAWSAVRERPVSAGPAGLLDPRAQVVGFTGREDELSALESWCSGGDEAGRVRLVTGGGGVGKTRLSVELMNRMRRAGWVCERVGDGREALAVTSLRAWTDKRALLVVDYAETRAGLNDLLAALAGDAGAGVRVLLLARSAGDWWDQLAAGEPVIRQLARIAKTAKLQLAALVEAGQADDDIVATAVRAFAARLGVAERAVRLSGEPAGRRILDLHAAALIAVLDESGGPVVTVDMDAVLDELLGHEERYWYQSASRAGLTTGTGGLTDGQVRQLVAAGALLGAATEDEARKLPSRVPSLAPSARLAGWLHDLYPPGPGEAGWLGSLQPDRLAELHVTRELSTSAELARACLAGLDARQARQAVTVLARASTDDPLAEELLEGVLPDVAQFLEDLDAPRETLTAIYNAITYPSVILAPAARRLCQRILALLPASTPAETRARWLTSLGLWAWQAGYSAEALPAEQEAVAIYRELAAANPDRYRPDLAQSLDNLGVTFSALGRPAEALPVTEEAAAIYRELAAAYPDRYRPYLAQSLSNLGVTFSDLGRPAEALPVTEEAVAIRRELAAANPDRYRPDLAQSLSNLGLWSSDLGRPAEALPVTEEAVAIYRELAAAHPDRYRPFLAQSLRVLARCLDLLGRDDEAAAAGSEAGIIIGEPPE
jgi:tetratricopeptide (TPR) repeat protein